MVVLSEQRRSLFSERANDFVTKHLAYEATMNAADPDEGFDEYRAERDFKDPEPYRSYLANEAPVNSEIIEENLVLVLHEKEEFIEFLKYFDQLVADFSHVDLDRQIYLEDLLAGEKLIDIAKKVLYMFMEDFCTTCHAGKYFDELLDLVRSKMKYSSRGEEYCRELDQARKEFLTIMAPAERDLLTADYEEQVFVVDQVIKPDHGLKIYRED